MVMQQCTECVAEAAAEHGLDDVALLVGGDFNCGTSEGVFEFLSSGRRRKIPSFWQHLFFFATPRSSPTANAEDPWPMRRCPKTPLAESFFPMPPFSDSVEPLGVGRRHAPESCYKEYSSAWSSS